VKDERARSRAPSSNLDLAPVEKRLLGSECLDCGFLGGEPCSKPCRHDRRSGSEAIGRFLFGECPLDIPIAEPSNRVRDDLDAHYIHANAQRACDFRLRFNAAHPLCRREL